MLATFLVLGYNRPIEADLCVKTIRANAKFDHRIVYLENGGDCMDEAYSLFKRGLVDKLILRKENSGCGLGTRELFNDFELGSDWVFYVQCDQFMIEEMHETDVNHFKSLIERFGYFYVDLAGNQGQGRYSERAHFINKKIYQQIPDMTIGGPGPFADSKWTEQRVQEYMTEKQVNFFSVKKYFGDNGMRSIREYPCGGILMQYTDTKQVYIIKPISKRVNFPNIHLTDEEWSAILENRWVNGTVPTRQLKDSFSCFGGVYQAQP